MFKRGVIGFLLLFTGFCYCIDNNPVEKEERYIDSITGFSIIPPAPFIKDKYYYPCTFIDDTKTERTKSGRRIVNHNKWKDNISISKTYDDLTVAELAKKIKEALEKKDPEAKIFVSGEKQLKGYSSILLEGSYKQKKDAQVPKTEEVKSAALNFITLIIKYENTMISLDLEYKDRSTEEAKNIFDKVVSSITFEKPTRVVHSFFSFKLNTIEHLLTENKVNEALELVNKELEKNKDDAGVIFCKGVCQVKLKNEEDAVKTFIEAFEKGFCDLGAFNEDPDLEKFEKSNKLEYLIKNKKEIFKKGREFLVKGIRKELVSYNEVNVTESNVILFTDIKDSFALKILKESINTAKKFAKGELGIDSPSYPIIWILSDDRDINKAMIGNIMVSSSSIGGLFISTYGIFFADKDTGYGVFVHECMHSFHHYDQNAANQHHPRWMTEMFSEIYTDLKQGENNEIVPSIYSNRLLTLDAFIKEGKMESLSKLITTPDEKAFKDIDIYLFYSMSKYLGLYLREKGLLLDFYKEYKSNYNTDKTGKLALEKVTKESIEKLDKNWQNWINELISNDPDEE